MPLTSKGETIKSELQKEYGKEKGEEVLYAGENKGTFTGIHDDRRASFWSYQASAPTPSLEQAIRAGAISANTSQEQWEQMSPGMRREIMRGKSVNDHAAALADEMKACADALEGLHRRVDAYTARRADALHPVDLKSLEELNSIRKKYGHAPFSKDDFYPRTELLEELKMAKRATKDPWARRDAASEQPAQDIRSDDMERPEKPKSTDRQKGPQESEDFERPDKPESTER